ncbi:hypothetical protein COJ48_18475 [Bacillus cereus]|nr:hypothetical protein COJ48_18475 [Bacillus cereus]PGP88729.1 hypothetical protein CN997_02370 [Bacillus cereus]
MIDINKIKAPRQYMFKIFKNLFMVSIVERYVLPIKKKVDKVIRILVTLSKKTSPFTEIRIFKHRILYKNCPYCSSNKGRIGIRICKGQFAKSYKL